MIYSVPLSIEVLDLDDVIDNGIPDTGCEIQFATFQGLGFELHKVDIISFYAMPEAVFVWAPVKEIEKVKATIAFINPHLSVLFWDIEDAGINGHVKLIADIKYATS